MSLKIAIASGKGGTGKTTVAVNLYRFLQETSVESVHLVDCDVEEPNDIIFLPEAVKVKEKDIFQLIPEISNDDCSHCRKCVDFCEFNAIVVISPIKFAEVNRDLCHSCGACLAACEKMAMIEKPELIGKVTTYKGSEGNNITEGKLKIGSAMQTMLIRELKKVIPDDPGIIIYDAPPGTSCPVVETICDVDYIILVTEPTPFGLHDLKLMAELVQDINIPFGVIINKSGLGNNEVNVYLEEKKIEIIGEVPFMKEYASNYASGKLLETIPKSITKSYEQIIDSLTKLVL